MSGITEEFVSFTSSSRLNDPRLRFNRKIPLLSPKGPFLFSAGGVLRVFKLERR